MEESLVFDHTVGGYCDPSYGQCFISYSLEQLGCGRNQDASEVGRIIQREVRMAILKQYTRDCSLGIKASFYQTQFSLW